jgi:hypothetical protein
MLNAADEYGRGAVHAFTIMAICHSGKVNSVHSRQ